MLRRGAAVLLDRRRRRVCGGVAVQDRCLVPFMAPGAPPPHRFLLLLFCYGGESIFLSIGTPLRVVRPTTRA